MKKETFSPDSFSNNFEEAITALANKGQALFASGQFKEALEIYDQIPIEHKIYLEILPNKAESAYHLGQYDKALKIYEYIIAIEPFYIDALINKILILVEASICEEGKKSEEYFEQAVITFNILPNEIYKNLEEFCQNMLLDDEYKEMKMQYVTKKLLTKPFSDISEKLCADSTPKCLKSYEYSDQDEGYESDELEALGFVYF